MFKNVKNEIKPIVAVKINELVILIMKFCFMGWSYGVTKDASPRNGHFLSVAHNNH